MHSGGGVAFNYFIASCMKIDFHFTVMYYLSYFMNFLSVKPCLPLEYLNYTILNKCYLLDCISLLLNSDFLINLSKYEKKEF